jgi:hypothetical protein
MPMSQLQTRRAGLRTPAVFEESTQAKEDAYDLLLSLALLCRAVQEGGQVSELRLAGVLTRLLRLLEEVGGFEASLRDFRRDIGEI